MLFPYFYYTSKRPQQLALQRDRWGEYIFNDHLFDLILLNFEKCSLVQGHS